MLTVSKYLNGGSPLSCYHCAQPFPIVAGHFSAWHGQDGKYYCKPDCEADALEARSIRKKVLS